MRTVIVGGPRCGKSTLATTLEAPIFCTDPRSKCQEPNATSTYLPEGLAFNEVPPWVAAHWFTMPAPWTIEGQATARSLRHWLLHHSPIAPCDRIILLTQPKVPQSKGQRIMTKGIMTVWHQIARFYQPLVVIN
jgi:hypothetical protein